MKSIFVLSILFIIVYGDMTYFDNEDHIKIFGPVYNLINSWPAIDKNVDFFTRLRLVLPRTIRASTSTRSSSECSLPNITSVNVHPESGLMTVSSDDPDNVYRQLSFDPLISTLDFPHTAYDGGEYNRNVNISEQMSLNIPVIATEPCEPLLDVSTFTFQYFPLHRIKRNKKGRYQVITSFI